VLSLPIWTCKSMVFLVFFFASFVLSPGFRCCVRTCIKKKLSQSDHELLARPIYHDNTSTFCNYSRDCSFLGARSFGNMGMDWASFGLCQFSC
jgi:hypothetical protein